MKKDLSQLAFELHDTIYQLTQLEKMTEDESEDPEDKELIENYRAMIRSIFDELELKINEKFPK